MSPSLGATETSPTLGVFEVVVCPWGSSQGTIEASSGRAETSVSGVSRGIIISWLVGFMTLHCKILLLP